MAVITVEGNTSTRAPQSRGLTNDRHLQARADGLTAAQDERPQSTLWYSVPDSVHCSRTSVLPRLGLARDPGGSCPRRTNSARTTSRPVTRTNRRTGDSPPTPHHVLGRVGRSCPLEPHPSPDAAGPTGVSGDSDTLTKARHDKDVKGPRASCLPAPAPHDYTALAPHDCKAHATHVYTALAPQDFTAPAPYERPPGLHLGPGP